MKKAVIGATSVLGLVLLILWGGLWRNEEAAGEPIRIAINPWPGYELLYVAEKQGFFQQEGLNVTLQQFSSLEDVRNAFEAGGVDGMCSTLVELIQAKAHTGKEAKVVLVPDFSNGADEIVAQGGITQMAKLKGRKIGVEAKSVGALVLASALTKHGLGMADIQVVYLDQASMSAAMKKGDIAAAVTYPPFSFGIKKDNDGASTVFDSRSTPGEIVDVVSVAHQVIQQNPQFVARMHKAWGRALQYLKTHPEEAVAMMAAREGISPAEFKEALSGLTFVEEREQAAYMGPQGKLLPLVQRSIDTLKSLDDLLKDPGAAGAFLVTP